MAPGLVPIEWYLRAPGSRQPRIRTRGVSSIGGATIPGDPEGPVVPSGRYPVEMSQPSLQFKRLDPRAVLPAYQSEQAAGLDLCAVLDGPEVISAGAILMVPCGFAMAIPAGWEAQVRPRSGLASRHGISMPNSPGTIDADYRGEVKVPLINLGKASFTVEPGMRIAQMVIAPVARVVIEEVEELDDTDRGSGGFGSTGR